MWVFPGGRNWNHRPCGLRYPTSTPIVSAFPRKHPRRQHRRWLIDKRREHFDMFWTPSNGNWWSLKSTLWWRTSTYHDDGKLPVLPWCFTCCGAFRCAAVLFGGSVWLQSFYLSRMKNQHWLWVYWCRWVEKTVFRRDIQMSTFFHKYLEKMTFLWGAPLSCMVFNLIFNLELFLPHVRTNWKPPLFLLPL